MLVDQLGMGITAQEDREIVKPSHDPLQLYPVDEENGDGDFVAANVVEKDILDALAFFVAHPIDRSC